MVEYPFFLWLAVGIVPLAIGVILWRERQTKLLIKRLGLVEKLINLDNRRRRIRYFLRLGVLVCLLVALARPKWGVAEQIIVAEGVGVVWVLDISRSMDVQDISSSRLERAKLMINVVMGNNPHHQFGMVIFASDRFVQFPLTLDNISAQSFVRSIHTDAISNQGTDLIGAVGLALDVLDERMISNGMMIILSDGEHNRDLNPLSDVVNEAVRRGVPIFTIGYGTLEGGMIPEDDLATTFVRDQDGEIVTSYLDETLLIQLAMLTGGDYRMASSTADEVTFIQQALDKIGQQAFERQSRLDYVPRFPIFVALALALIWIDGIVGYEKKHPIFDGVSHHSL